MYWNSLSTIVNLIQRLYNCGSNIHINKNDMINLNNKDSEYIELPNIGMNSNINLDGQLIELDFSLLKKSRGRERIE